MSKLENLEKRLEDLEINVGSAMRELGLIAVSTREASGNYRNGMNKPFKMINSAIVEDLHQVAFVIDKTPIYEYDEGTAIYDLHIANTLAYFWHSAMYIAGGVIRAMTVADIKKFFEENPSFAKNLNLVQDINHKSDIYLIP